MRIWHANPRRVVPGAPIRASAVAGCFLLCFISSANLRGEEAAKDPAPGEVQWSVESSHTVLPAPGQNFWVRLRLHAPELKQAGREPLNLSVVFDRSASMNIDSKIGFVRKAGHILTDNLTPTDYVSLIAYNHEVQVLVAMHPVVNREYLHHRIDELTAAGDTNISGGFLEGCAQLEKRLREPGQHHVILLTDGLANRGVTDARALVSLVQRAKARGIGVTTIGVGTDFNESLLTRMAQAGGGHYAYAANADQIPTAIERELGSLLAVSAQNVSLKMDLPAGIEVLQVYGREEAFTPGVLEESLGDLTSGEERRLLIKFHVSPKLTAAPGSSLMLRAELSYDNLAAARRSQAEQTIALEQGPLQTASATRNQNPPSVVLAYAQLVDGVDKIALAVKSRDHKLAAEVMQIRERQFPALKQVASATRDQDFVNNAYLLEHYSRELAELIEDGALHDHSAERARLQKDLQYRRYMSDHHRGEHSH
ncbi:MAG: VWA domain-containing protein [Planctomycetia bacterium]|nr:VWA domain-containing protein [Planctomycetia bacterium]